MYEDTANMSGLVWFDFKTKQHQQSIWVVYIITKVLVFKVSETFKKSAQFDLISRQNNINSHLTRVT